VYDFVLESVTSIAETICRCAVLEQVFLRSESAAADELRRAFVKLYANILTYLAKVKACLSDNVASMYKITYHETIY
jgi:hypothetical protein